MKRLFILFAIIFYFSYNSFSQTYFEIEPTFNCNCGTFTKKLLELKTYTDSEIKTVFDFIKSDSRIEFSYPQGGCQQRAEMMHFFLSKRGIEHARIWVFAPIDLERNATTYLEIKDKNGLAKDSIIKWGYHVAPCVLMKDNNSVDTMVIDPSLISNKPVKFREWLRSMKNSEVSKYTFLEGKYYFFNTQDNGSSPVINGFFYAYIPVSGITTMFDNATVERELAVNDVAMYLKKKMDAGYQDSSGTLKILLGNVNNMVSFFASQQRCNTLKDITVRSLILNNSGLMEDVMKYYVERTSYWMNVTK